MLQLIVRCRVHQLCEIGPGQAFYDPDDRELLWSRHWRITLTRRLPLRGLCLRVGEPNRSPGALRNRNSEPTCLSATSAIWDYVRDREGSRSTTPAIERKRVVRAARPIQPPLPGGIKNLERPAGSRNSRDPHKHINVQRDSPSRSDVPAPGVVCRDERHAQDSNSLSLSEASLPGRGKDRAVAQPSKAPSVVWTEFLFHGKVNIATQRYRPDGNTI
jgi:hypothetical protein